jgi:hypothetical protein
MVLKYVLAISSARRLRLLAERSTYVIASAYRGQVVFRCCTGLHGRCSENPYFSGDLSRVAVMDIM